MLENATSLEILWFTIGLFALVAGTWNLVGALLDWLWARTQEQPLRRVARTSLQRAVGWLSIALLQVYIGGVAMLLPATAPVVPVDDPILVQALRLSTITALIVTEIVVAGMIGLEAWERRTWRRVTNPVTHVEESAC